MLNPILLIISLESEIPTNPDPGVLNLLPSLFSLCFVLSSLGRCRTNPLKTEHVAPSSTRRILRTTSTWHQSSLVVPPGVSTDSISNTCVSIQWFCWSSLYWTDKSFLSCESWWFFFLGILRTLWRSTASTDTERKRGSRRWRSIRGKCCILYGK